MGEVIVITSGKGGVGKTTVTANLGAALSKSGKKVCVLDTDMGLRNLDLALGLENNIVYDAIDVVTGICTLEQATVSVEGFDSFDLIPAPQSRNCDYIKPEMIIELCDMLRKKYDYILLDSPAGIDKGFRNAVAGADKAIIVTQPYIASVRDADRAIDYIEKTDIEDMRVIINAVRVEEIKSGILMNVDSVVDLLGIPVLGIVPWDENIPKLAVGGKTVMTQEKAISFTAYKNIASRINGESVPVMDITPPKKGFFSRFKKSFS